MWGTFSFFYTFCVLLCEKYNFGQDINWKWRNTFIWMYLNANIQSSFSYIWCRVCLAHQRSAPGLGLSGCPHKWNTYGNLPQWSAGLGNRRSQNINTLLSPSGDLGISLVWHNLSPPHHPTATFRFECWNPLQSELNYLWGVLSCSQDDIRWF